MKSSSRRIALVAISILAFGFSACTTLPPASEKEKLSYAIGMQAGTSLANSLKKTNGDVDPAIVLRAISTTLYGGKLQMSVSDAQATVQAYGRKMQEQQQAQQMTASQKNGSDGLAFLAANAMKPGVKTTASGLQYQVEIEGAGPRPKASDTVKVNYTGTLLDGTEFDSSANNGGPLSFQLRSVIPGWTEGLQLMPVGSKFTFWIPSRLAYGERGTGPIGANATLKFEVELLSIGAN